MGHGLHLAVVQEERGLHQGLAVACGAGAHDAHALRQLLMDLLQGADGGLQRAAVIIAVEGIEQGAVLPHQSDFGGGGAGVDAQERVAFIVGQAGRAHMGFPVALPESVIGGPVGEKGFHALYLELHLDIGGKPAQHLLHGAGDVLLCVQGGAYGGEQMGVVRIDGVPVVKMQRPDEGRLELRQEMQRAAQERHISPDGLAAGQAGDGLVHHGLEDGGGQILLCGPLVDQGLDVRLGEHAAAGGDGVEGLVVFGVFV